MSLCGVNINMLRMLPTCLYKSWIIVLCVCQIWIYDADATAKVQQDEFLKRLDNFEITIPSRVTREGHHVTYNLHPGHTVRRRSVDSVKQFEQDHLHYKVNIENVDIVLQLQPNYNLISPAFVIERKKNRFKNVTDSMFHRLNATLRNCHYQGHVINQSASKVAVGVCDGLHGFIHTKTDQYFIEPIIGESREPDSHHRHVIYRRSALPVELDPLSTHHVEKRSDDDDSCGVKDTVTATKRRKRWEAHHRRKRKSPRRTKRSISTERYAETLVVVDPQMASYHESERLDTYVLTIMNMVATMFHDATIGNSINIVLVRIMILEDHEEDLVITHHADKTLNSFCKYQKTINFKDDDHPNHHDVAILLTRHNICSRLDEPCSTLGLAQVSGMCQPHRSCNINEDTGLALAYTVTHELGHNFGMHHDGAANGCEDPPGKQLYIMSPSLIADSLMKSWSNCSKNAITTFIDRDWGYCLDDEPADHEYVFPVLPAGTMYDADHQCRLQYGTDQTEICTNKQDVCTNLWCKVDNRCSTHLEAAAEGTICGDNQWCYEGKCVKIGERPEAINGEWGEWSGWSGCTRTCGAGVSRSQRHCDNPQPSHGGKYCLGERKRYRICNTEDCSEGAPSFNTVQCEEFNYIPYKNGIYEWEHVPMHETPCQLHCKPTNQFFSVLLKDIVTDGTHCTPGTRNMCIGGRCTHVGCDYVIDSKAREDRCGICHGDGTTCTMVKSNYTESQGLGYVEAAVIPTGARNIRVEEVAAANNFLALQNDVGEYKLNGHWFIQWSGDYKVAGTIIQYERVGNKETFVSPGPLKEPLHVMLLLQSENPGLVFEYTVPKENISDAREPEFHWIYQTWTHCTASCGGGTQRSEIVCTEIEAGVVDHTYCSQLPKPDDKQKVCNEHQCPARWWVGPWQHCSATCGNDGVHQRTVICVRSLGPDEQIALDDEACVAEKPAETEPCHKKEPCPGLGVWAVGEWSSCNGNVCGLKYRTANCDKPAIGCHHTPVPKSEMACGENVTCGHWVAHDWMECTRSCGDGIQYRRVTCEDGEFCNTLTEPTSQKNCSNNPCPVLPEAKPTETKPSEVLNRTTSLPGLVPESNINNRQQIYTDKSAPTTKSTVIDDENMNSTKEQSEKNSLETNRDVKHGHNGNNSDINVKDNTNFGENGNTTIPINDTEITEEIKTSDTEEITEISHSSIAHPIDSITGLGMAQEISHNNETVETSNVTSITENSEEITNHTLDIVDKTDTSSNVANEFPYVEENKNTETVLSGSISNTEHTDKSSIHKHRHHHGEASNTNMDTNPTNTDASENVKISDENNTNDIINTKATDNKASSDEVIDNDDDKNKTFTGSNSLLEMNVNTQSHTNSTLEIDSNPLTSSNGMHSNTSDLEISHASKYGNESKDDMTAVINPEEQVTLPTEGPNAVDIPTKADLPTLSDINNIPPLPNQDTFPSLDKPPPLPKNLSPLPDLDKLPPLPNYGEPFSPSKDAVLPLAGITKYKSEQLPPNGINDASSLSGQEKSSSTEPLSIPIKSDMLPGPDELPQTVDQHSHLSEDKLPPPASKDHSPPTQLLDKTSLPEGNILAPIEDLPPLPSNADISSLPSFMPLPDHQHLPPLDKLPPLPDRAELSPLPDMDKLPMLPDMDMLLPLPDMDNKMPNVENLPELPNPRDLNPLPSSEGLPTNIDSTENKKGTTETGLDTLQNIQLRYHWQPLDWTECSRLCGDNGVRTRSVACLEVSASEEVEEISCDIEYKPTAIEECNRQHCQQWQTSEWSQCSATCGYSIRARQVVCRAPGPCNPDDKPARSQTCDVPKCIAWVSGQWSRCTKTCGNGEQFRMVQCVNLTSQHSAVGCDTAIKPSEKRNCGENACPVQKAAALSIKCEHNEMSYIVCRALKRMNQCHRRFVSLKCCKTCRKTALRKHRTRAHSNR